jgi:hypothetical protein
MGLKKYRGLVIIVECEWEGKLLFISLHYNIPLLVVLVAD